MQAQLEDIVPCGAISRHLEELAHLYEATCPAIANIYALIAPLSPESLPGGPSGACCVLLQAKICTLHAYSDAEVYILGTPSNFMGDVRPAMVPFTPLAQQLS